MVSSQTHHPHRHQITFDEIFGCDLILWEVLKLEIAKGLVLLAWLSVIRATKGRRGGAAGTRPKTVVHRRDEMERSTSLVSIGHQSFQSGHSLTWLSLQRRLARSLGERRGLSGCRCRGCRSAARPCSRGRRRERPRCPRPECIRV